ncbi:MAG TPA: hypothetical protein VK254_03000, partial [Candidatus Bathyarchaeia archaeon]|nr:hypothetical protein [Candidatus Bathyarchaeia archaeon]
MHDTIVANPTQNNPIRSPALNMLGIRSAKNPKNIKTASDFSNSSLTIGRPISIFKRHIGEIRRNEYINKHPKTAIKAIRPSAPDPAQIWRKTLLSL